LGIGLVAKALLIGLEETLGNAELVQTLNDTLGRSLLLALQIILGLLVVDIGALLCGQRLFLIVVSAAM
jgi:hypothetical protein